MEVPVLECVVKQFFDHFAQQANDNIKLPIELTNTTGTCLHQHMNDYCLLEIFTVNSLTLLDLCSLAETCTRFQQITQRVFPKKLSIAYDTIGYKVISENYSNSENRPSRDVQRILKNFGSILMSISIRISDVWPSCWRAPSRSYVKKRSDASKFILNLIERHCANTLQFLWIDGLEIRKLKSKRLSFLEIRDATIMGDETLFTDFESLGELRLINVEKCNKILRNVYPKLRRFTYEKFYSTNFSAKPLSVFISCHKSLETIDLDICGNCSVAIITQAIANSCTKLKELTLYLGLTNTASLPLQAIKSLETLKLQYGSCENFEFIPALTELRELHLYRCDLPNNSNQFDLLTQLTKLHL